MTLRLLGRAPTWAVPRKNGKKKKLENNERESMGKEKKEN